MHSLKSRDMFLDIFDYLPGLQCCGIDLSSYAIVNMIANRFNVWPCLLPVVGIQGISESTMCFVSFAVLENKPSFIDIYFPIHANKLVSDTRK